MKTPCTQRDAGRRRRIARWTHYIHRVYISYTPGVHVRRVVHIKHTGERRSWILISLGGLSYLSSRGPPRDPARGTLELRLLGGRFKPTSSLLRPFSAPSSHTPSFLLPRIPSQVAACTMAGLFTWITRVLFTQVAVFKPFPSLETCTSRETEERERERGNFPS